MKRPGARGLTLIELLVIIAIIFVIMAIVFPICTQPRCSQCGPSCLSNLKQLGLAWAMYAQDYDDAFLWNPAPGGLPTSSWGPSFQDSDCAPQPSTSFVAMLMPYVVNQWVFQCPKDDGYDLSRHLGYTKSLVMTAGEASPDPTSWINRIGYGFNEVLIGSPCRPRTLASLKHAPEEVALFSDAEQPWASTTNTWAHIEGEWGRYWVWDPRVGRRHGGHQVFVFADGRAKVCRPVVRAAGQDQEEKDAGHGYFPEAKLE